MKRLVLVVLALSGLACSSTNKDQVFLDELAQMSKEEILAKGDAFAEEGDRIEARRYYAFLADSFPNDPVGRRAALKIADSYFQAKDIESITEAQLRYKDFASRFPNDPSRAYALLQLAKTYARQRRGPLRDLTPAREAVAALDQVLEMFPDSEHAAEAKELRVACREDLALHELEVARYYLNTKGWRGAYLRLTYLLEHYPESQAAATARELLAQVNERLGDPVQAAGGATPGEGSRSR